MPALKNVLILLLSVAALSSCGPLPMATAPDVQPDIVMGKVGENEYEVRIYDQGFNKWFARNARPVNFHTQQYYELMNDRYASVWNEKAASKRLSLIHSPVHIPLNYDPTIDYGLEIDYILFHYFQYVEYRYGRLIKEGELPSMAAPVAQIP